MDCEKFDRVVLDLLYEELDELTSAAAKRHMEHCSRCRGVSSGLRATREIGILPLLEPPADLEQRILSAERRARAELPLRQRMGRAISMIAGYAMRPQLAMAALLLLMIGSSLLLLRARPGGRERMEVTERGVPESESESVAIVPAPEKPQLDDLPRAGQAHDTLKEESAAEARRDRKADEGQPGEGRAGAKEVAAAAEPSSAGERLALGDGGADQEYDQALAALNSGRYSEAQQRFESVASAGGANAPSASFYAAQAARSGTGCSAAAPRFDAVNARYTGSSIGNEAAWQAADCWRSLGEFARARRNYQALLQAPGYAERAQEALAALDTGDQSAVASRKARAAPKAGSAPAAAPKAAPAKPADKANSF
jgi:TolA-binding protein